MDVRRLGGRIAAALRALAAGGSLMPIPSWVANGLAMISLVLSSCDLLRLCSDRDRRLLFPLRCREFVTVFCQLASIVYLFGHLRGRQIKREEKCDEGGVGGGCWEIRDGDAGRYPWPSSSMATRKKMTCGSLMS